MRIENDLKLGFKNIMIRPKRSTLKSRSQVNIEREFTFLHSDLVGKETPNMDVNIDTVETFEIAKALFKKKLFASNYKHFSLEA